MSLAFKSWYYRNQVLLWLAVMIITPSIALFRPEIIVLPTLNLLRIYFRHPHNTPMIGTGAIWFAMVALGAIIGLAT